MAGPFDGTEDAALWRRFRAAADAASAAAPDALLLAAYAEDRLPPAQAEAVEDWLADHPEAIGDIAAARQAGDAALPAAGDAVLERALALVAEGDAQILSFPSRAPARRWQAMAAWGAMAASILVTSLVGFTLGNDTYSNLAGTAAVTTTGQDLLDPPTGLFYSYDEDQST